MRRVARGFVLLFCGFLLLGCQTSADYFGSGPLTLTPLAKAGFKRYINGDKSGNSPGYFAISEDGGRTSYGYSYCPAGSCGGNSMMVALHSCEGRSKGLDCKIYAEGSTVVWRYNIATLSDQPPPTLTKIDKSKTLSHIRDKDICRMAISNKSLEWDGNVTNYVAEAKDRGISLEQCQSLSGYAQVTPQSPSATERLKALKKLERQGLITKKDAAEKRKEILKDL